MAKRMKGEPSEVMNASAYGGSHFTVGMYISNHCVVHLKYMCFYLLFQDLNRAGKMLSKLLSEVVNATAPWALLGPAEFASGPRTLLPP